MVLMTTMYDFILFQPLENKKMLKQFEPNLICTFNSHYESSLFDIDIHYEKKTRITLFLAVKSRILILTPGRGLLLQLIIRAVIDC
jgi:hypothetical protein